MSNDFFWVEFREELRSMIENYWKSRTLMVTISHLLCPITLEALYQVFSAYGLVEKIIPVQESSGFQVLVQYQERQNAISATFSLQGRNIYDGCCQMDIQFGNDSQLTDDVEPKQEQKVLVSTVEVLTAVELGGNLLESTEWAKAEHKPLLTVSNEVKMFDELSMPTEEESDGFDDSIVVSLEDDLIKSSELDEVMENGSVFEGCERVRNMRICRQFSKMDGSHQNGQFKQLVSIMKRMGERSDVESRDVDQLAIDMGNNKTSSLPQEQEVAGDKGLCLKGANAEWVRPPLPNPMSGINLLRDVMEEGAWLELVASSSDLWILALAFVYGATTYNITQEERVALYGLITGEQSIADALHEWNELQVFDQLGDLPPPQPAAAGQQMGFDELGGQENLGGESPPML